MADEKSKPRKKPYQSKEGFVEGHYIKRGRREIALLIASLVPGAFICGGYVRYMCSTQKNPALARDVDIYCENDDAFSLMRTVLEMNFMLKVEVENQMAVSYEEVKGTTHKLYYCPRIQLIKPIREGKIVANGTMKNVLENFDFTVVRIGLMSAETVMMDADFEHDEAGKILRLKNIHCPISSTHRCMKYHRKGYWLPPSETVKLFIDWMQRDDSYRIKIVDMLKVARDGGELTQKEVDELEALMRID